MTRFVEAIIIKDGLETERIPMDERMVHKYAGKSPSFLLTTEGRRILYDDIQIEETSRPNKEQKGTR